MKFIIFNTKENRPATPAEIDSIVNPPEASQIYFSWSNSPKKDVEGVLEVDLDSSATDNGFVITKISHINFKSVDQLHLWEIGDWDGMRSDFVLVKTDKDEYHVARAYGGTMDGSEYLEFYTKDDFEIDGNVTGFCEID